MLEALEDIAVGTIESCIEASGILHKFENGNTFLAVVIVLEAVETLDNLNTDQHSRYKTVSGQKQAVASVKQR